MGYNTCGSCGLCMRCDPPDEVKSFFVDLARTGSLTGRTLRNFCDEWCVAVLSVLSPTSTKYPISAPAGVGRSPNGYSDPGPSPSPGVVTVLPSGVEAVVGVGAEVRVLLALFGGVEAVFGILLFSFFVPAPLFFFFVPLFFVNSEPRPSGSGNHASSSKSLSLTSPMPYLYRTGDVALCLPASLPCPQRG